MSYFSIVLKLEPFLMSNPELLAVALSSDAGLETQGIGDSSDTSVQGRGVVWQFQSFCRC
jgi:hypothetical protein